MYSVNKAVSTVTTKMGMLIDNRQILIESPLCEYLCHLIYTHHIPGRKALLLIITLILR